MKTTNALYLGDGVYVDVHPLGIVLTTENGIDVTNRIVLEPEVYDALTKWVARVFLAPPAQPTNQPCQENKKTCQG